MKQAFESGKFAFEVAERFAHDKIKCKLFKEAGLWYVVV